MKPQDIYNTPPIKTSFDLHPLLDNWHPHLASHLTESELDPAKPNTRIEIKIHYDPYIDGNRCCTVGSAWFDNKPVMIFRHGGRSGHDAGDECVTDLPAYLEMLAYLESLRKVDDSALDIRAPDEDVPELNEFYNHDIREALLFSGKSSR